MSNPCIHVREITQDYRWFVIELHFGQGIHSVQLHEVNNVDVIGDKGKYGFAHRKALQNALMYQRILQIPVYTKYHKSTSKLITNEEKEKAYEPVSNTND